MRSKDGGGVSFKINVHSNISEKQILHRPITIERRRQLHISYWGNSQLTFLYFRIQGFRRRFRKRRYLVQDIQKNASIDNPIHQSSPSRSSFIHSSVGLGA